MPFTETIVLNPTVVAQARADHILRTQNRIAQFQQKLKADVTSDERALIEAEVVKFEAQIEEARNPRPAEATSKAEVGGLVSMVQSLSAELTALKAALFKPPATPKTAA